MNRKTFTNKCTSIWDLKVMKSNNKVIEINLLIDLWYFMTISHKIFSENHIMTRTKCSFIFIWTKSTRLIVFVTVWEMICTYVMKFFFNSIKCDIYFQLQEVSKFSDAKGNHDDSKNMGQSHRWNENTHTDLGPNFLSVGLQFAPAVCGHNWNEWTSGIL